MTRTIFALATPPGRSGVAVIRVSGPDAGSALDAVAGTPRPEPRVATLRRLRTATGEAIDTGLVLWFPAPNSFTGEDMAELHLHGGPAVIQDMISRLGELAGLAPAEAGAFTRRAFHNGKLDLTAVEGLADLIDAETAAQRRQARRQLDGRLSRAIDDWRERLIRSQAHLEAAIDFSDEDLPEHLMDQVGGEIGALSDEIDAMLADNRVGERLRGGLHLAIVGAPNAGKSSLLNALARREAAIVADTAGTTRDVVEVHLDVGGYPVSVADTAGLRALADEGDPVEQEGIRRALDRAGRADLRLALFDATAPDGPDAATAELVDADTIVVATKTDRVATIPLASIGDRPMVAVSSTTGHGLDTLLSALEAAIAGRFETSGETPAITRERHRAALAETRDALDRARQAQLPELAAEDLRLATRALGRVTGAVDVEDLLDVIFKDFCIGK